MTEIVRWNPNRIKVIDDPADLATRLPNTPITLRIYVSGQAMENPEAEADKHWLRILAHKDSLKERGKTIAEWETYNEIAQNDPVSIGRKAVFELRLLRLAADTDINLCLGNFGEGNPANLSHWEPYIPVLQEANRQNQHGKLHKLGLHEYWWADSQIDDGWHGGRFQRMVSGEPSHQWKGLSDDCRIPILIGECGVDGGIVGKKATGWKGLPLDVDAKGRILPMRYLAQLQRYDLLIRKYTDVQAAYIFCSYSADRTWESFWTFGEVDLGLGTYTHKESYVPDHEAISLWRSVPIPPLPPPPDNAVEWSGDGFQSLNRVYSYLIGRPTEGPITTAYGDVLQRSDKATLIWIKAAGKSLGILNDGTVLTV